MSAPDTAVSVDEFEAALVRLGGPRRVVLAVSGGPDSMALARLAAASRGLEALAVTVDHGLRPEARGEAETVARWCAAAGLDHRIVAWLGPKPRAGVQAAARAARYRLLAQAAETWGGEAVLTGHTADDQAETVFMRLARGSGPAGLAAMDDRATIAAGPGAPTGLLRPLLTVARERIAATLAAFGQPFLDDPSNDDPGFERVRTRALLAALGEQDLLTREALCRAAARAGAAARRLAEADGRAFAAAGGCFYRWGWARLAAGAAIGPRLAARLVHAVGGGDYAPDAAAAGAALDRAIGGGTASLGGALIRRAGNHLFIYREPAALLGRAGVAALAPAEIGPGAKILWDRRFIVENRSDRPCSVIPLGEGAAAEATAPAFPGVPAAALAAAPALAERTGAPARLADEQTGLQASSLAEERFSARIVRFP